MTPEQIPIPEAFAIYYSGIPELVAKQIREDAYGHQFVQSDTPQYGYEIGRIDAYRHLTTTPTDTGARWVKASERLPDAEFSKNPVRRRLGGADYAYGEIAVTPSNVWMGANGCQRDDPKFIQFLAEYEWLEEGPAPAPLQDKGIREAIEERMKELEALIAAEKRQRADLPRGSAYHLACTHSIDECRIRYEELVKLLKYVQSSSPLPLSDKK